MKRLPNNDEFSVDPIAQQLWEDIVYSMDQYTHDSMLAKFFLPDEILLHCRSTAAAFAQLHFAPIPSTTEVYRTRLFALFLLAMSCGVQIYLKERSMFTNFAPYNVQTDHKLIREARHKINRQLEEGIEIFSPIDQVMGLFLSQLAPVKQKVKRYSKTAEFNEELFDKILPVTILWGYLFAKELIVE